MVRRVLASLVVSGCAFVWLASGVWADQMITEAEVPPAVKDVLKTYVPNAVFVSGELEKKHDGKAEYELNVKDGEDVVHMHVTDAGKVKRLIRGYAYDDHITPDKLPQAVKDSLNKIRPNAEILEAETGHHHGRVAYEIKIKMGEGMEEIEFSEKGDLLKIDVDHDRD